MNCYGAARAGSGWREEPSPLYNPCVREPHAQRQQSRWPGIRPMKTLIKHALANLALAAITFASAPEVCSANSPTPAGHANYARPFDPPTRPALIPLPPGAVEPAGWLRDWCLAARDGFTGHMDEYDIEFKRAWAPDHKMTGERLNWPNGAWPYEGGGYWFDGLSRLGFVLHDDALLQQARRRFDAVATNVTSQGILFLWWLNKTNSEHRNWILISDAWPMWASGLLGRAMAGYYAGSRDHRVLRALEAAYSGDPEWVRLGWAMSNPWPAFDTYAWTGNREIGQALTALFSKEGGGRNTGPATWNRYRRMPNPAPGAEENDHVVHFLESTTPWALGYLWTGNRAFLDTTLAWHDLLERVAMQPSGVPVADEYYGPAGAFRGTETCDVAAYLWSQIALLSISGQGRLADRAERAFFNAGPAAVARDFKTHVYFQTPNRLVDKSPPHPHGPQAEGNSFKPKHYPLCCTAALNRIIPNYVMHQWMATSDNGLAATLYGPCTVSALVADRVPVQIICRGDYPFNDVIDMTVKPAKVARFPLAFRIPGWCQNPVLSVNRKPLKLALGVDGFVRVERRWNPGDAIRLQLPMTPQVQKGRDDNAQGAPCASVSYGPLLFALPIPEAGNPNTPAPTAKWNYALDLQAPGLSVERDPMPAHWDWPLAAPLKLRVNAAEVSWIPDPKAPRLPLLPCLNPEPSKPITLVPYGCTKFRISMFPITAEKPH